MFFGGVNEKGESLTVFSSTSTPDFKVVGRDSRASYLYDSRPNLQTPLMGPLLIGTQTFESAREPCVYTTPLSCFDTTMEGAFFIRIHHAAGAVRLTNHSEGSSGCGEILLAEAVPSPIPDRMRQTLKEFVRTWKRTLRSWPWKFTPHPPRSLPKASRVLVVGAEHRECGRSLDCLPAPITFGHGHPGGLHVTIVDGDTNFTHQLRPPAVCPSRDRSQQGDSLRDTQEIVSQMRASV